LKTLNKFISVSLASVLLGVIFAPISAQADLAVPKITWPACDDFRVDFCIESISVRPLGTKSDLVLTWYDSGRGPEVAEEVSPAIFIAGPEVLVPGQSGEFAANLPDTYADVPRKYTYTGTGTLTSIEGIYATASISVDATVEQADGTLELFADLNLDGEYSPDELVASKYIAIGSPSLVGTGAQETQPGRTTSGRWGHEKWSTYGLNAYGYDGLTIDLKTANVFTNHLFFTVYPVKAGADNKTSIATRTDGSGLAANLNMDDKITVKVRTGEILTGVSIAVANSMSFLAEKPEIGEAAEDGAEPEVINGTLTISGTPVPVPQIRSITQCVGEDSTATAVVNTMQGFVVVENDDMGFGVDGLSGRLVVGSNGASCGISTPVWDEASEALSWQAGAPHFEPDGVTTNKGFYKAIIPANDALLLWGLQDPKAAVTALTIQVTEETGGSAVAASKISYLKGNIIIDITGFTFSKPKIKITKKAGSTAFAKKRTLTCTDPNTKEKVVLANSYGCPSAEVAAFKQTKLRQHTLSTLNSTQKSQIKSSLNNYLEANKYICTGIWLEGATMKEKIDARRNAKQACDYAKSLDPSLSYWYQTKSTKAASYKNSVLVTMKAQD
jgi:hypothetical protein